VTNSPAITVLQIEEKVKGVIGLLAGISIPPACKTEQSPPSALTRKSQALPQARQHLTFTASNLHQIQFAKSDI
jgi:hypothetical protein